MLPYTYRIFWPHHAPSFVVIKRPRGLNIFESFDQPLLKRTARACAGVLPGPPGQNIGFDSIHSTITEFGVWFGSCFSHENLSNHNMTLFCGGVFDIVLSCFVCHTQQHYCTRSASKDKQWSPDYTHIPTKFHLQCKKKKESAGETKIKTTHRVETSQGVWYINLANVLKPTRTIPSTAQDSCFDLEIGELLS